MNPYKVVIQDLIWAVYSGDVRGEVGTAQVYLHYYLRYNYMFRLLTIAIFRLYMNP